MSNINEFGSIELSLNVFRDIANITASKFEEISPAKKSGYSEVRYKDNILSLSLNVRIRKDADTYNISNRLQNKVHESILEMTGLDCSSIDIHIEGFY